MNREQTFRTSLREATRIALTYFRSEERWSACALLVCVIIAQLTLVGVAVAMNTWRNAFFQALQEKNWPEFLRQFWIFGGIGVVLILATVYQQYMSQWLSIRWRRWLTERYLDRWLNGSTHYHLQVGAHGADNPDQRVAEDVRLFIDLVLSLGTGLLGSVASLFSFVTILWGLSAAAPLLLFGETYSIPGYLVWAALLYAILGTAITHLIGRPLIPLNFEQERREADFRFSLVRLRENSEGIAFLKGEQAERSLLRDRFQGIIRNWHALMNRQKALTFFAAGYRHYSLYFPYLVIGPLYFAGSMQLGAFMQSGSAFNEVRSSFSFFITAYVKIAELIAAVQRLSGFTAAIDDAERRAGDSLDAQTSVVAAPDTHHLRVRNLEVTTPDGAHVLASLPQLDARPGERIFVTGVSGAGKTSLLRALDGIWPFARGEISRPEVRTMVLPQRPYIPIGSLRTSLAYPQAPGAISDSDARHALEAVGLAPLEERLDAVEPWSRRLSDGEQQRLGLARALLYRPDLLMLDEATSALDETAESRLHAVLREQLSNTTIITVSHRSALKSEYDRTVVVQAPSKVAPPKAREAALDILESDPR